MLALFVALTGIFATAANGANVSVTASLSNTSTEVGQPVELSIEIHGSQGAHVPQTIDAKGLNIVYSSQSSQFQMQNFNVTSSVTYTYTVQPQSAGKYVIPAITIEVDGQKFTTEPLNLTVGAGSSGSGSSSASSGSSSSSSRPPSDKRIAFAELVVPRQTAYVGETIPVEVRIYFDANVRVNANELPTISADGFTVQKPTQPRQEQIVKDGKRYNFVTYKTAVTPVKSGKLTLGPAEMSYVAVVPMRRPKMPGMDDFFNDDAFGGMFGRQQQFSVSSSSADLEVKPLPKANQPPGFSGAVGQFSLSTEASPLKLNIGDPITLKLKVTGRGNFDLVTAPKVTDAKGWRSYPPSGKFTADDDVGISGSKTFEMAVIPDEKKSKLPPVEFSYFDPVTEKYVTLHGERLPITVEGEAPAPAPVAAASAAPSGSATAAAPEAQKYAGDIHYLLTGPAHWGASFTPVFLRASFWEYQGAPLLALLALIGFRAQARRRQNVLAQQMAGLRREKSELMKKLQHEDIDAGSFYDAASRYIQVEAAHGARRNPSSLGLQDVLAARKVDAATVAEIQSIFGAHDELRYAGGSVAARKLPAARRQSVLETIRKFENASE